MSKTKKVGYYLSKSGKDVIDWCEDFGLMDNAYVFTIMKYLARAGKKPGNSAIQDLKKALDYLTRYINYIENQDLEDGNTYDIDTSDFNNDVHKLKLKKDDNCQPAPVNPIYPMWVGVNPNEVTDMTPTMTCDGSAKTVSVNPENK